MGFKLFSSHSFRNFLRIYVIFFLCVCIMFIPIYINNYYTMEKQEKSLNMTMLQNGAEVLDDQIMSLMNLVQVTYADTRYRTLIYQNPSTLKRSYYQLPQIISNFKGLVGATNIVKDAGIILNEEVILTRYRSFLANDAYRFYGEFFSCQDYTYPDWLTSARKNAMAGGFLPEMQYQSHDFQSYSAITFVTPWRENYKEPASGLLYATIRSEDLIHTIVSNEIAQKGYILIYDDQDNLIFNHQYYSADPYFTIRTDLKNSKLHIVVGIPFSLINGHLAPIRATFFLCISVILLVGIALILFFAYNSNKPIRKVVDFVEQAVSSGSIDPASSVGESEYEYITTAVSGLTETIDSYSRTIEIQKSLIRNNTFDKALVKGLHNQESLTDFRRLFPDFPECFQLAAINYEMEEGSNVEATASLQLELLDEVSQLFGDKIYKQLFDERMIVLLLPTPCGEDFPSWISALENFYHHLNVKFSAAFQIALSEVFADCRDLSEAFLQIRDILYLSRSNRDLPVWQLHNFPQRAYRLPLDYMTMQQLYDALLAGDTETTQSIFQSILKSLTQADAMHEIAIHQTCNSLRNLLLRIKIENMPAISSISIPINDRDKRISEILEEYNRCCMDMCMIFKEAHAQNTDHFAKSICSFILENYTDDGLYATTVSDHFGISDTTLQKTIKKATGKTFSKYVEDLRLEKAYDLLKNTDGSINEISASCGFASSNSFYKAFKRKYSFPPSILRGNKPTIADI